MDQAAELRTAQDFINLMSIKTTGPKQAAKFLSGGNQQKVVLSRWLSGNFEIGLFDEPTKGIDVKAKEDIYQMCIRDRPWKIEEGKKENTGGWPPP